MPDLDSYLERFENYLKEQEEKMKSLIRTIGGAEFVDVLNLMHVQGAVIGLKKTCVVNVSNNNKIASRFPPTGQRDRFVKK